MDKTLSNDHCDSEDHETHVKTGLSCLVYLVSLRSVKGSALRWLDPGRGLHGRILENSGTR